LPTAPDIISWIITETVQLGGINPANAGTVTGTGDYKFNDTAVLTAVANAGFKFANWSSDGVVISEANPLTIIVTKDTVITANFVDDKK
jgi:hypothetical protein